MLSPILWAASGLLVLTCIGVLWNLRMRTVCYTVRSARLPAAFDGFRLLVVTDLHDSPFADQILAVAAKERPDAVCFVGDMVYGSDLGDMREMCRLLAGLPEDAPAYAVSGNHEIGEAYRSFVCDFVRFGGVWLDDSHVSLRRGTEELRLIGLRDRKFEEEESAAALAHFAQNVDPAVFSVTLCHRPFLYPRLADAGTDLVLSGHMHGGLIRLPFIGGLINHEYTKGPRFDRGLYDLGRAPLIVSAGCDDGRRVPRANDPPEVLMVTLEKVGGRK